jgi:uncharacterized membrane protein YgcG
MPGGDDVQRRALHKGYRAATFAIVPQLHFQIESAQVRRLDRPPVVVTVAVVVVVVVLVVFFAVVAKGAEALLAAASFPEAALALDHGRRGQAHVYGEGHLLDDDVDLLDHSVFGDPLAARLGQLDVGVETLAGESHSAGGSGSVIITSGLISSNGIASYGASSASVERKGAPARGKQACNA